MDGDPRRIRMQGFPENFFCLQIAAVSQIDIRLGDRIHIAGCIELTGRVSHRHAGAMGFAGVNALASAGAKEGVRLQTAFKERTVYLTFFTVLAVAIKPESGQ